MQTPQTAPFSNSWPPPLAENETEEERVVRRERESEAKRVSNIIDDAIEMEKAKRRRPARKILLLGQAEAGKSTVLKNFQLHFAPKSFEAELHTWKPIIHLNVIRSVNFLLDLICNSPNSPTTSSCNPDLDVIPSTDNLRRLKIRLVPLRQVEDILTKRLSGSAFHRAPLPVASSSLSRYQEGRAPEVTMRSGSGWKRSSTTRRPQSPKGTEVPDEFENAERVLCACRDDIVALWGDDTMKSYLRRQQILLEEQSGFFLSDISRIGQRGYRPTPNDVLRARIQTVGVEEHHVKMETTSELGQDWAIYDIGGSSGQRREGTLPGMLTRSPTSLTAAWAAYFDDVDSILFLVPISAFNQSIHEEGNEDLNRLADSLNIWKSICSNKILACVHFQLMFNKLDVLESKLKAGIRFSDHVKSYSADHPNSVKDICKYLLQLFTAIHKTCSPRKRMLHSYLTCAIDTRATYVVLDQIRETIMLSNLSMSTLT